MAPADTRHPPHSVRIGGAILGLLLLAGPALAEEPAASPAAAGPDEADLDRLLALLPEADPEWGAFLSGDCTACHREGAGGEGIPDIVGWPAEAIATSLAAYRSGLGENPTMRTMAQRLSDEEIAALAVYFESRAP